MERIEEGVEGGVTRMHYTHVQNYLKEKNPNTHPKT